jgi:hypothetical protein
MTLDECQNIRGEIAQWISAIDEKYEIERTVERIALAELKAFCRDR